MPPCRLFMSQRGLHIVLARHCLLCGLIICILSSCTPKMDVDQSTPEAVVESFITAGNENNIDLLWAIMDHEDPSNRQALEGARKIKASGLVFLATNVKVTIVENDGQTARVRAVFDQTIKLHDEVLGSGETGGEFTCVKRDEKWYLVGVGQSPPPGWVIDK